MLAFFKKNITQIDNLFTTFSKLSYYLKKIFLINPIFCDVSVGYITLHNVSIKYIILDDVSGYTRCIEILLYEMYQSEIIVDHFTRCIRKLSDVFEIETRYI